MTYGNNFPNGFYNQGQQFNHEQNNFGGSPTGGWGGDGSFNPAGSAYAPPPQPQYNEYHQQPMTGAYQGDFMSYASPASPPSVGAYGNYSGNYTIPQPEYVSQQQPWSPPYGGLQQSSALVPLNTNTGLMPLNINTGMAPFSPSSASGPMSSPLLSPSGFNAQGGQLLSQNPQFMNAISLAFGSDPNINDDETKEAVRIANKLIPGMQGFNSFLSVNGLRWDEGQKFKFAMHSILYRQHYICENSKDMAVKPLKKPGANMLCGTLGGGPIETPNDEALQQIVFLGTARGFFDKSGVSFSTVAVGVTDHIVDPINSVIPERLTPEKYDKPEKLGFSNAIRQAGAHHFSPYSQRDVVDRPVHLFAYTDGISKSSQKEFTAEIEQFLKANSGNRVTICINQDSSDMKWAKVGGSGGSKINFLNSLTVTFQGRVHSLDDYAEENKRTSGQIKNPSDYFYSLAMGAHDPAVMRDAQLMGTTVYGTKTQAMLDFGKSALPKIAAIGIKVALTV